MSLAFIILSVVGLSVLFWKAYHHVELLKNHFWPGLILKIVSGAILGVVYYYHYGYGDTLTYFKKGTELANILSKDGFAYVDFLLGSSPEIFDSGYQNQPRALFFIKVVSVFSFLSGGNYWITSIYFSTLSFFACFYLATVLAHQFSYCKNLIAMCFLYIPSTLLWTSGIIKESVAMAVLCVLFALVIQGLFRSRITLIYTIVFIVSAWVLWKVKYYYAAIAFTSVFSMICTFLLMNHQQSIRKKKWRISVAFIIISSILLFLSTQLHPNLLIANLPEIVVKNYDAFIVRSQNGGVIIYENLEPTFYSLAYHSPKAFFSALFRPFLWEWDGAFLRAIYSLENSIILILLITSLVNIKNNNDSNTYLLALAALFFVIVILTFLALSTPNFGTLARYKSMTMPFILLIITYRNPSLIKLTR